MNTSESGSGMSKGSPYDSARGISKYSPSPSAMGCPGLTTHTRSFSPMLRQYRPQLVPISFLNILEKWAECRGISPMPSSTRW